MALVQFGGGIISMRGSMAGNTFVRSPHGTILKKKSSHPTGYTDRSQHSRIVTEIFSSLWSNYLTTTQRKAWTAYGRANPFTTKSGTISHHGGKGLFIKQNYFLRLYGMIGFVTPPTTNEVGTPIILDVTALSTSSGGALTVTLYADNPGASDVYILEVTPPLRPGIKSPASKYVFTDTMYDIGNGYNIILEYERALGTIPATPGQKLFVQGYVLNKSTGTISAPIQTMAYWT